MLAEDSGTPRAPPEPYRSSVRGDATLFKAAEAAGGRLRKGQLRLLLGTRKLGPTSCTPFTTTTLPLSPLKFNTSQLENPWSLSPSRPLSVPQADETNPQVASHHHTETSVPGRGCFQHPRLPLCCVLVAGKQLVSLCGPSGVSSVPLHSLGPVWPQPSVGGKVCACPHPTPPTLIP